MGHCWCQSGFARLLATPMSTTRRQTLCTWNMRNPKRPAQFTQNTFVLPLGPSTGDFWLFQGATRPLHSALCTCSFLPPPQLSSLEPPQFTPMSQRRGAERPRLALAQFKLPLLPCTQICQADEQAAPEQPALSTSRRPAGHCSVLGSLPNSPPNSLGSTGHPGPWVFMATTVPGQGCGERRGPRPGFPSPSP